MHLGIRQPKLSIKGEVSQHLHQASHETFPSDAHLESRCTIQFQPENSSAEWASASTAHGTSEALLVCGRSIGSYCPGPFTAAQLKSSYPPASNPSHLHIAGCALMTHLASLRGMRCLCHFHMTKAILFSRGVQLLSQFAECLGQGQLICIMSRSKRGLIGLSPTSIPTVQRLR